MRRLGHTEIKRIDDEIKQIVDRKVDTKTNHDSDNSEEEAKEMVDKKKRKKCRYDNKGFCKYNNKCSFSHPKGNCQDYLQNHKC